MKTYYVISEIGFEYNDEIYYIGEGEAGTPKRVLENRSEAARMLKSLEASRFSQMLNSNDRWDTFSMYCYDISDICDPNEVIEALESMGIGVTYQKREPNPFKLNRPITEREASLLPPLFSLSFYTITKIEEEDA